MLEEFLMKPAFAVALLLLPLLMLSTVHNTIFQLWKGSTESIVLGTDYGLSSWQYVLGIPTVYLCLV